MASIQHFCFFSLGYFVLFVFRRLLHSSTYRYHLGTSIFNFYFFLQVLAITIQCPVLWGRRVWYNTLASTYCWCLRVLLGPLDGPAFDWIFGSKWSKTYSGTGAVWQIKPMFLKAFCIYFWDSCPFVLWLVALHFTYSIWSKLKLKRWCSWYALGECGFRERRRRDALVCLIRIFVIVAVHLVVSVECGIILVEVLLLQTCFELWTECSLLRMDFAGP
jgi:hypothetical protein